MAQINRGKYWFPLLEAILYARQIHGNRVVAMDGPKSSVTYNQLFTRCFILANHLKRLLANDEKYVAILLPNTLGVLVAFMSLQVLGRVPCMLNFSSGESNISQACRLAGVKTILTSRQFIEQAKLELLVTVLEKFAKVIYLEDERAKLNFIDKAKGLFQGKFPEKTMTTQLADVRPDQPAVILYTSGSEGSPKGVALSHANILANIAQINERINFKKHDMVFNALPVFHSFGLSIGMLMPLICGLKTYLYPSPLRYKVIPHLVKESGATIMLGTDTFYQGYAASGTPSDFNRVWLAVAGAEKLKDSTFELCRKKLGIQILQGYGVTEASPVISCNTPGEHKQGTVGRAFPDIQCKLEPVPGLEKGGRLFVSGPNIMLGYLDADRPGMFQPQDEWYDTGDIVDIDREGYITILGRAKRFAKIGGEMVSLVQVEDIVSRASPEAAHAAVAVPDERKGEQIVLFSEDRMLTMDALRPMFKGKIELGMPRDIIYLDGMPRLPSGKIDYMSLAAEAKQRPARLE